MLGIVQLPIFCFAFLLFFHVLMHLAEYLLQSTGRYSFIKCNLILSFITFSLVKSMVNYVLSLAVLHLICTLQKNLIRTNVDTLNCQLRPLILFSSVFMPDEITVFITARLQRYSTYDKKIVNKIQS